MIDVVLFRDLRDIPAEWYELFEQGARRSPFLSATWFENYFATVVEQDNLNPLVVGTADSVRQPGVMLILREDGRALRSLSNYYSALYGFIGALRHEVFPAQVDAIVEEFTRTKPRLKEIWFQPFDSCGIELATLDDSFKRHGWLVRQFFCFGNWYLQVEGRSYSEYQQNQPSSLRNTISRKRGQFDKAGGWIELYRDPGEELRKGMEAYETVYAHSWKKAEPYPGFVPGLVERFSKRGEVRLGVAWVDKTPVSAQIWLVSNGEAHIFKLAYDHRYRRYSPGTVLSDFMFRYAIDVDHVCGIDFLSGDDAYKSDWMSHRRERWGIVAFNPRTPRGLGRGIVQIGRLRVKRFLQSAGLLQ